MIKTVKPFLVTKLSQSIRKQLPPGPGEVLVLGCPEEQQLTGQREHLVQRHAVVEGRRHHALGPQAARAQLVHAQAGGHRVVARPDPVVGRRGEDEPDPTRAAPSDANQLPADVRHGDPPCVFTRSKKYNLSSSWGFLAVGYFFSCLQEIKTCPKVL